RRRTRAAHRRRAPDEPLAAAPARRDPRGARDPPDDDRQEARAAREADHRRRGRQRRGEPRRARRPGGDRAVRRVRARARRPRLTAARHAAAGRGSLPRIRSAAFSAIMIVAAFVFARVIVGITDASTTRRPSTPKTRSSGSTTAPIAHVDVGWYTVWLARTAQSRMSASESESGALSV